MYRRTVQSTQFCTCGARVQTVMDHGARIPYTVDYATGIVHQCTDPWDWLEREAAVYRGCACGVDVYDSDGARYNLDGSEHACRHEESEAEPMTAAPMKPKRRQLPPGRKPQPPSKGVPL